MQPNQITFSLLPLVAGFLLDLWWGDPTWMVHPVRLIGTLISYLEKILRRVFDSKERNLLFAGAALALIVCGISFGLPFALLLLCRRISPYLALAVESFWCWQIIALKDLETESMLVYKELAKNDLQSARNAVSRIVGRDTQCLSAEGVAKAAVETVAENTSDGVVAPLLFMAIGGAPLGFLYKAINTMDSMMGYKNDRYIHFGRAAAKLDDAANLLPSRIAALLMILSAFILRFNGKNAYKIFLRDRFNHSSPNSAQTEAVCAGALEVQLAGDAYYFGKLTHKKTIGDSLRPIEAIDIMRANKLLYGTAILSLALFSLCKIIRFIV